MDCRDQVLIDKTMLELDGDPFKKNLGANATLGVSMACALAPTGIIMNSWKSTVESACDPPLITLHIGTGNVFPLKKEMF